MLIIKTKEAARPSGRAICARKSNNPARPRKTRGLDCAKAIWVTLQQVAKIPALRSACAVSDKRSPRRKAQMVSGGDPWLIRNKRDNDHNKIDHQEGDPRCPRAMCVATEPFQLEVRPMLAPFALGKLLSWRSYIFLVQMYAFLFCSSSPGLSESI